MNVLYVGSSRSAKLVNDLDLKKYTVCCVNNAWRLFEEDDIYAWIHSGDLPYSNRPKNWRDYQHRITHKDYRSSSFNIIEKVKHECKSPMHYLGYTIFFLGLYWIMDSIKPTKISLLGFDHDYNPKKTEKWLKADKPSPQTQWKEGSHELANNSKTYNQKAEEFFKDIEPDHFYGQGTPDPMRLGERHLIEKFEIAKKISSELNIELVNISPVTSKINTVKKENIL